MPSHTGLSSRALIPWEVQISETPSCCSSSKIEARWLNERPSRSNLYTTTHPPFRPGTLSSWRRVVAGSLLLRTHARRRSGLSSILSPNKTLINSSVLESVLGSAVNALTSGAVAQAVTNHLYCEQARRTPPSAPRQRCFRASGWGHW